MFRAVWVIITPSWYVILLEKSICALLCCRITLSGIRLRGRKSNHFPGGYSVPMAGEEYCRATWSSAVCETAVPDYVSAASRQLSKCTGCELEFVSFFAILLVNRSTRSTRDGEPPNAKCSKERTETGFFGRPIDLTPSARSMHKTPPSANVPFCRTLEDSRILDNRCEKCRQKNREAMPKIYIFIVERKQSAICRYCFARDNSSEE